MQIIGIDVGNYDTKTQHTTTPSGFKGPYTERPPIANECLLYGGNYYIPVNERFPYEKDKTHSDRCIILSLLGIAKEICFSVKNARPDINQIETANIIKTIHDIAIGVGLPPSHYTRARIEELSAYYNRYFDGGINFTWNDFTFKLNLRSVSVYPQGGAGAADEENEFRKKYPAYYVIDIGGYTIDILKFAGNQIDGNWASKEEGIITMYDGIIEQVKMNYDMTLDYGSIESVLKGEPSIISLTKPDAVAFINSTALQYSGHILDIARQAGVEFSAYPVVFMGGGALLLKNGIRENPMINEKAALFINDPCANAKGYARFVKAENPQKG